MRVIGILSVLFIISLIFAAYQDIKHPPKHNESICIHNYIYMHIDGPSAGYLVPIFENNVPKHCNEGK